MKYKVIYVLVAGFAFTTLAQNAIADEKPYYKVLSRQTAVSEKADIVPMEKALSFPVVVERTRTMSAEIAGRTTPLLLEETTALPLMLERTTVAKPHHWPLSFGVWP